MESILVLTDFSDAAFQAAKYAGMLAGALNSKRMVLFNAIQSIPAVVNEPAVSAGREALERDSLQTMDRWRNSVSAHTPSSAKLISLVEEADLAKDINFLCEKQQAGLVVMGITGKTNLEKTWVGSNTIRVLQAIRFPLLVVPGKVADRLPGKVVLATDLKEVREKMTVPALTELLDHLQGKLLVVNVEDKEQAASKLRTEITALHDILDKYQPEFHYLSNPDTAEALNLFALENQADMIITLHGRSAGIGALFHKSVSKKLAWHSQIPLLVIPV